MVDIAAIAGVASSLKAASDLTKAAIGLRDAEALRNAVINLQSEILSAQAGAMSAQSAQFTLTEKVRDLEKEVAALKAWEAEKARYEMMDLYRGLFAYVLKLGEERGEPPHALCANCYQKGFKSVLQSNGEPNVHHHSWDCPSCKTKGRNQWRDMKGLISKSRENLNSSPK